jgi:hypothetical protein
MAVPASLAILMANDRRNSTSRDIGTFWVGALDSPQAAGRI